MVEKWDLAFVESAKKIADMSNKVVGSYSILVGA